MGRLKKGASQAQEKALTRFICQKIRVASQLSPAQIEKKLGIGANSDFSDEDGTAKKTGRSFLRYCDDDESKSRSAPRDNLQTIINKSIDLGWLPSNFLQQIGGDLLTAAIPLQTRPSESFQERLSEIEQVAKQIQKLKNEIDQTTKLLSNLKHTKIIEQFSHVELGVSDFWPGLWQFIADNNLNDPLDVRHQFCPPTTILQAIEWLNAHLDDSHIQMKDGFEPSPKVRFKLKKRPLTKYEEKEIVETEAMFAELASEYPPVSTFVIKSS